MSSAPYLPVQVLRRYITDLEAALAVCQAEPTVKAVHRLRTGTRRAEAMLLLLDLIPGLPEHTRRSARLQKALTHLRRAAGMVRDLDVHREMLELLAQEESQMAGMGANAAVSASVSGGQPTLPEGIPNVAPVDPEPHAAATLQHAAHALRHEMAHARDQASAALQAALQKRQSRTTLAAERLLHTLAPAAHTPLPLADLLGMTESVLRRNGRLTEGRIARLDEDQLHDVRKAAKAARYIAETAPDDTALQRASRRYEALQEAGGLWHDALELEAAARKAFGRHHPLTALYRTARKQRLADYRSALLLDLAGSPTSNKAAAAAERDPAPPETPPPAPKRRRPARKRPGAARVSVV